MTELDTLKRARMYVEKLANGINPLDDSPVGEGEVLSQVRISRCLFYVTDVLDKVIADGGLPRPRAERLSHVPKEPFQLSAEQRARFQPSEEPIAISALARRINELSEDESLKRLSYRQLRDWLLKERLLYSYGNRKGKFHFSPSQRGEAMGIEQELHNSEKGTHAVLLYGPRIQQHIVEHLEEILTFSAHCTARQHDRWTRSEEQELLRLFAEGVSLIEISERLQRDTNKLRRRMNQIREEAPN